MIGNKKIAYFIGIGGIGMSALARYFKKMGWQVAGYDRTATSLTDSLINEGIAVHFDDKIELIPEFLLQNKSHAIIIYTPAVPADHKQKNYLHQQGFEIMKRSEVLGELAAEGKCIAIAGTHGKTTTTTLVAHILYTNHYPCNAFLGGISTNYNTNLLLTPDAEYNVVEADEYDRSFLKLFPVVAVVTSMDADHLDIYGDEMAMHKSYNDFVHQVKPNGKVVYKLGLPLKPAVTSFTYSILNAQADYSASNIRIVNGNYSFDVHFQSKVLVTNVTSGLPGRHNVENALAAFAAAHQMGMSVTDISAAIASYKGVKRRFEYIVKNEQLIFIDDYAHHPEELRACISSVKEMYPNKKITGVFQPHLFSRTRDFATGFAISLDLLDRVLLLDIYPARELPIEGVSSQMLLNLMKTENKKLVSKENLLHELKTNRPEVLVTLGAGDIDKLVEPIKQELTRL